MAKILDVAKYIINYFQEHGDLITNLKLQKLLYYVQGWHLALYKEVAFNEEFQAWVHGPVNAEVYQTYKKYQWRPIIEEHVQIKLNTKITKLTDEVLEIYGTDSAISLELRTHMEEPWILARRGLPEDATTDSIITKDSMQKFFSGQITNNG